ncbi:hypothetical protein BUALT_Bualt07G0005100 [Buddleja alternifolia]|uniref:Sialate O-acetylesterase domain-containing protein n=1 Tax=Buddleja alternifolia TaxID=168488 RepID=A0AAV6XDE6_9LAMI|nr:hypothetical protein BUALT_Bualt07G0005100 [Buddleja alternifolia]
MLKWEEAQEPLHRDIDSTKICGVGPGMAFSNSVLERDSDIGVIGLVPCAIGGTKISEWSRGGNLYNQLVTRALAALRGGGIIRAILWYQGESDASNNSSLASEIEDAIQYNKSLTEFITNVTSDLRSPLVPFIQVWLYALTPTQNGLAVIFFSVIKLRMLSIVFP